MRLLCLSSVCHLYYIVEHGAHVRHVKQTFFHHPHTNLPKGLKSHTSLVAIILMCTLTFLSSLESSAN